MLKLTIRDLMVVHAIAESANLKAAAQYLSITPSALTHRIQKAEQQVGAPLFERRRGRIRLTRAGTVLLDAAQTCIRELDKAESILADSNLGLIRTVHFGGSTLSGLQWYPDFMRFLTEREPDLELEIALDSARDPVDALRVRSIDVALLPFRPESATFDATSLFEDEMVAVLAAKHPKSGRERLLPTDFQDETYVGFRPGRERGREYERFFAPASVTPKRLIPGRSIETIIALVRAGVGITIMTRWSAAHYLATYDLLALPLGEQGLPVTWYAVARKESEPDTPAGRVVASLTAFFAEPAATPG